MAMADCLRCGGRIVSGTNDTWAHLEGGEDGHEARPARGTTKKKTPEPVEAPRLDL